MPTGDRHALQLLSHPCVITCPLRAGNLLCLSPWQSRAQESFALSRAISPAVSNRSWFHSVARGVAVGVGDVRAVTLSRSGEPSHAAERKECILDLHQVLLVLSDQCRCDSSPFPMSSPYTCGIVRADTPHGAAASSVAGRPPACPNAPGSPDFAATATRPPMSESHHAPHVDAAELAATDTARHVLTQTSKLTIILGADLPADSGARWESSGNDRNLMFGCRRGS